MTYILEYQPIIESISQSLFIKGEYINRYGQELKLRIKIQLENQFNTIISGESDIYISKSQIEQFIIDLAKMHGATKGNTSISCQEFGTEINFLMGKSGALFISGRINYEFEPDSCLNYNLTSDQTIIPPLIKILKELIS